MKILQIGDWTLNATRPKLGIRPGIINKIRYWRALRYYRKSVCKVFGINYYRFRLEEFRVRFKRAIKKLTFKKY